MIYVKRHKENIKLVILTKNIDKTLLRLTRIDQQILCKEIQLDERLIGYGLLSVRS